MAQTQPGSEAQERLQRDADELDERIERLNDHIGEARQKAQARHEEGEPLEDVAGDWEDTEPDDSTGEDPSGFDDPESVDQDDDE